MNNIYKVIWSKAKNCYVVASEIARSHTKSATGSEKIGGVTRRSLLASLMALSLLCGGLGAAEATVHVNEGTGVTSEVYTTGETYSRELVDEKLNSKANAKDVATNTANIANLENNKLSKADASITYATKADVNTELTKKADKTYVDNALNDKADKSDVYSKTDVNTTFATKTELSAKADTAALGEYAKTADVNNALSAKADKMDLDTANGNITDLQKKTANLNADGTKLTDMTTVETGTLKVTGGISNDTGVTTTLTDINNSMKQTATNTGEIANLKTKTDGQQTAINGLNEKTTQISYDAANHITSVNGMKVGQQVDMGGKDITNARALTATGKVTGDGVDAGTGAITGGSLTVTGKVTGNGVDAGAGDITTTGNVKGGTLETTGNATIGGALSATGKVTGNGVDAGTGDITGGSLTVTGKVTGNGVDAGAGDITTTGNVKGGTLETTGDATIGRNLDVKGTLNTKDVTAETIHISKSENNPDYKSEGSIIGEGGKLSVSNEKFDKRTNITEKSELNVNEKGTVNWATSTDATGNKTEGHSEVTADNIKNFVKKTEGGKTFGYEENITADGKVGTVTDKEGNTSSTRQDSKGIYGYAKDKDGNKSYTKQEGNRIAESVIGQDGKETKSEMTSTGITNTAKDGTITNTAKNVTNEGTESVTNKVGNNEVKVSQNGVDIKAEDGKKITESVGTASRVVENDKITDKAADSTVTTENGKGTTFGKEGSTGTTNIYGDSIRTGTINAEDTTTGKLTAGAAADANGGRLTVDANDGVKGSYKSDKYTSKSYILANTLKSGVDNGKEPTEDGFVGSRTDHYMDGDKAKLDETVKDAAGSNVTNKTSTGTVTTITDGTTSTVIKQDKDNVTIASSAGTVGIAGKDIINAATDTITNTAGTKITDTAGDSSVTTENGKGTTFTNTGANTAIGEGTVTDTTIKGNTITTGKVTMDYAEVMKDLGVTGKTTTGSLEVKGESKLTGNVTMENNATVGNDLTVKGITNTKTLNVTEDAKVGRNLAVDGNATIAGDVTARSYNVGGNTYIDADGIHANNQKITDVADGSISEGSKDAVNGGQLYTVKNDLEGKVNKVGANAAAMANLHPMEFDPDSKWNIAAAIGNYGSETAAALGAFYRPNDDVMVNLSTAFGTGENMVGGGVSVRLGKGGNKLSREESNALKDQVNDLTARMDALLSVLNPNMSKDFPDVPENHWAYEAVSRLAGNDIVQGYPDGEFHGERTMTRYEMAEIIYNALSRGAEAEKELVEEFKPELQAMAASEKATAERAEG